MCVQNLRGALTLRSTRAVEVTAQLGICLPDLWTRGEGGLFREMHVKKPRCHGLVVIKRIDNVSTSYIQVSATT